MTRDNGAGRLAFVMWLLSLAVPPSVLPEALERNRKSGYLRRTMESGAVGFLLKEAPAENLARALRRVVAGERVVWPWRHWRTAITR